MGHIRKFVIVALAAIALALGVSTTAGAAPLPDNCTKVQGQVTCTTFEYEEEVAPFTAFTRYQ